LLSSIFLKAGSDDDDCAFAAKEEISEINRIDIKEENRNDCEIGKDEDGGTAKPDGTDKIRR
jgi:hypothetical protein